MTKKSFRFAFIITIISAVVWGMSGTVSQYLFMFKGMNSTWLAVARLLVSGIFLLVIGRLKAGALPSIYLWKNPKDILQLLFFSLMGITLCQYAYLEAIRYSDAGVATMLEYVGPALVMLAVSVIDWRLPKKLDLVALILVSAGVFYVATEGNVQELAISSKALFWGLAAALGLAINSIMAAPLIRKWGAIATNGWGMFIGGIVLAITQKPTGEGIVFDLPSLLAIGFVIFFGTVFAFTVYLHGLSILGPVTASMIASLEPVAAAVFAAIWLGTTFSHMSILGFAFIIIALFLLAIPDKKQDF